MTNNLPNLKIVILHNTNTVAMYMSPDQTFFITIHALQLAKSEEHLGLLIGHELSHYLLDHNI